MKFRPLPDRVVAKRIDAEEKTAGGIIIPDTAKESPPRAKSSPSALAVATRSASPIDVQVGDRVLFGKWLGIEVKIEGQELLIMKESDIMGVLTDTAAGKPRAVLHPEQLARPASRRMESTQLVLLQENAFQDQKQRSTQGKQTCQLKNSNSASTPATACCAVSTF
jgi:chaperonin GroES